MSKDAYYFSHDSNARNDEKIISLRMEHGWRGYGIYWALIEKLRDESDYTIERLYKNLAFEFQESPEVIKSVVEDFGLFEISEDGKRFYSKSLLKRMKLREEKSQKAREAAEKRWGKERSNADAMRSHSDSNAGAMQGKERKGKENKGKKDKDIPAFEDFSSYALEHKPEVDEEALKFKYESWKENDWRDGNNKEIKNWKVKLLNTLPHMKIKEKQPDKRLSFLPTDNITF